MEGRGTFENLVEKFGPLTFDKQISEGNTVQCFLCSNVYNKNEELPVFLKHLFEVHHLVVEDIQNIHFLREYVDFWREKFQTKSIEEVVPAVKIDSTGQVYFLISTLLKDDKELRHKLKLKHILQIHEFERIDTNYLKPCLFCKLEYEGTRPGFLKHLSDQHNLQLGNPQNLVLIEELVELINTKFKLLKCLYCEKTFPERHTLKEHMRKKLHKRINPQNQEFDKFYLVNYLEVDKDWHDLERESDSYATPRENEINSEDEYSDWTEEEDKVTCLVCSHTENDVNVLCQHMIDLHNFDFVKLTEPFDFYQKLKLVNFIRKQFHTCKCFFCDESFKSRSQLNSHLQQEQHFKLPDSAIFDQPEFYFPTFENDAFLYFIDDLGNKE